MKRANHWLCAALLAMLCVPGSASAVVNEAHEHAMVAANPYVEKGFSVRREFWEGKLKVGKKKAIRHQLFKGNEYWFWAGFVQEGVKVSVKIYDKSGRPVDVETKSGDHWAGARVLAPKTGTYVVVITAELIDEKEKTVREIDWALAYGYR